MREVGGKEAAQKVFEPRVPEAANRGKKVLLLSLKVLLLSLCRLCRPFRIFKWPHAFLSMIFGIFGKFGIGIGGQTYFCRENVRRKKISEKNVEHFLVEKWFFDRKNRPTISRKIFSIEKIDQTFYQIFGHCFPKYVRQKCFRQKYFPSPIPIPNFLKILKIMPRKACGHLKIRNGRPRRHRDKSRTFRDKSRTFFPLFVARPRPGRTRFKNLLYTTS